MGAQNINRKNKRTFILVATIILAIVTVGVSAFVLLRPGSDETVTSELTSSVVITDRGVAPAVVTVKKGATVTWINQSDAPHRLAITSPNPPREMDGFGMPEPIAKGESYSYTFESAGSYTYDDPENPEYVKGTVVVE